jgi:hypothetical protein
MEIVLDDIDTGKRMETTEALTEFQCVVRMNEGIKQVVQISSHVDMAAVNAMLMSKRAGLGARGFGVVSSEMRAFSDRLDQSMSQLNTYVLELVSESAKVLSIHKRYSLCNQLARIPAELSVIRDRVIAQLKADLDAVQQHVQQLITLIQQTLKRAQRLCSTGIALSRNGKIEAVQCGALASAMALSADAAEADVASIVSVLKSVHLWAAGAMAAE